MLRLYLELMNLMWRMLGLAREYRLFNGKQIVGLLKNDFWNRKAYGELKGTMVRFEKDQKLKYQARILDIEGEKVLGSITFSSVLGLTARYEGTIIRYEGETYEWVSPTNESRKSWTIVHAEDQSTYHASGLLGTKGEIREAYLPAAVLLAGLYVHGYLLSRTILGIVGGLLLGGAMAYWIG